MNAGELRDAVLGIVQDNGWADVILDLFNVCRGEIAGEIDLPGLHTVATVTTSASSSSVALPDTYSRGLYWVGSASQKNRIGTRKSDYHNLLTFLEKYPVQDQVGLITDVAIQGSDLLYQGMAADTLTLRYYAAPTALTVNASIPAELPEHLHKALLVNFACRELYTQIEDGIEGGTPNTTKFDKLYQRALIALRGWAALSQPKEPKYVRDMS